jgi:type VI secretion system secreted protein VgrG
MDAAQRYMPRLLEEPRIHGIQTAVVVGAEGTEIDVDKLGRVLLAFRWDRRDPKSGAPTRRVRVSQGWSGTDRGFVTLPRVGDEVLVAYLDGDPANPLVVGRVHNAASVSPLKLPSEAAHSVWKSRSTPGGKGYNEIRMDDTAGAEKLTMHAQRDFKQVVENDAETVVGRNETRTVKGNRTEKVKGDRTIEADGALNLQGKTVNLVSDTDMDIHSGKYMQITSDTNRDDHTVGFHTIKAGAALFLKSDSAVQIVAPVIHAFGEAEIHLQVGGSSIHITSGGIEITSSGDVEVNGGLVKLNCN